MVSLRPETVSSVIGAILVGMGEERRGVKLEDEERWKRRGNGEMEENREGRKLAPEVRSGSAAEAEQQQRTATVIVHNYKINYGQYNMISVLFYSK